VTWKRVSRADILRAIKDYDLLGSERFNSEHGFVSTTMTYELAGLGKTPLPAESDLRMTRHGPAIWRE
jgi:hypothetical protein